MAYCSFDDAGTVLACPPRSAEPAVTPRHDPLPATEPARLSALEWSVVALARRDRLSSLRRPGRLALAMRTLFGGSADLPLADERLEALRRMAVWSWHHGYTVPTSEVRAFVAAGFSIEQYELLQTSIGTAQQERGRR